MIRTIRYEAAESGRGSGHYGQGGGFYWRGERFDVSPAQLRHFRSLGARGEDWSVQFTFQEEVPYDRHMWYEVQRVNSEPGRVLWISHYESLIVCWKAWDVLFGGAPRGWLKMKVIM